jgi:hypothetical protein
MERQQQAAQPQSQGQAVAFEPGWQYLETYGVQMTAIPWLVAPLPGSSRDQPQISHGMYPPSAEATSPQLV